MSITRQLCIRHEVVHQLGFEMRVGACMLPKLTKMMVASCGWLALGRGIWVKIMTPSIFSQMPDFNIVQGCVSPH